jgi:hypothetical protein
MRMDAKQEVDPPLLGLAVRFVCSPIHLRALASLREVFSAWLRLFRRGYVIDYHPDLPISALSDVNG